MKILHTADWHIGKSINGQSLLEDQQYVLNELYKAIEEHKPDIVIISGDLYDLHYPSKDSMVVLEDALSTINLELDTPIIAISGNHDGKERLNYGEKWFEKSGLKIITQYESMFKPIEIKDVHIYVMPYFTPADIKAAFKEKDISTHQEAADYIVEQMKLVIDKDKTNILVGHLFVSGGKSSDSERPLSIGTIETVDASTFDPFDIVMLGHLHHPFAIQSEFIFYSGSLMQYSFSEEKQAKGFRLFDVQDKAFKQSFIPITPRRSFHVVNASYNEVIHENITIPNKDDYFHFKLTDMDHVTDPLLKIRKIYPNTLQLSRQDYAIAQDEINVDVHALSDLDIIKSFYKHVTDEELTGVKNEKIIQLLEAENNKGADE
ncbi:exonuclease subunit SbcD [Mammaliicoccus stepanovicii]|uniref:Nuclease SbcCD subunit D n=1 Tax=Mammaliicoccus stepanovicii TaxID=643214 RepID=A0A239ZCM8_9STAP|nr:exonuclease subunit SbcD [Mammaliicoccus stepanovicii]PNZ74981.1 exonuclease sbcCD subunit D [Mammaliicoccus stepanovicii]GGI42012.1 nuclease SbcCD subunit D [Mammaliicoccus stepanovicii]SNV68915.1 SbcD protein [Mammaliicoccus stepanovicii]